MPKIGIPGVITVSPKFCPGFLSGFHETQISSKNSNKDFAFDSFLLFPFFLFYLAPSAQIRSLIPQLDPTSLTHLSSPSESAEYLQLPVISHIFLESVDTCRMGRGMS